MPCAFEIVCLGNELLIGKIANSNAQWLAKYITSLGGKVQRITVAGDDEEEISSAIKEALSRRPDLIITTGGLGPTFDDKTVEAVAMALERPLELNGEAFSMVREKYRQYEAKTQKKIELTPARVKMAKLPKGAIPLPNPVGTAPGVLSECASARIVSLPGVPSEMRAIFEESVVPLIRRSIGDVAVYEKSLDVTGVIESELAPLIDGVMRENPYVYIKSHPKAAEPLPLIELHLSTTSPSKEEAENRVETAGKQISQLIGEHGGKVKVLSP